MQERHVYTFRVHDEGPDGLWAEVMELPGCFASGDTMEELNEALLDAISLYLSTPERRATVTWADRDDDRGSDRKGVLVSA